jgi:hypothetical protein
MACKSITTEVEDYEVKVGLSSANQQSLYDIKSRFSNELTNLLAAAKNYAGGAGISPVSLVDAAAGNLTSTIVDLVKLLGMRPIHDNEKMSHENNVQSLAAMKNEKENMLSMSTSKPPTSMQQQQSHILSPDQLSVSIYISLKNPPNRSN